MNMRQVHQSTQLQLDGLYQRYQQQVADNAAIKKQMNEVYVKLMAGKRGFKIPQDVEEILLKNLQDSMREGALQMEAAKPKVQEAKNSFFLTSAQVQNPAGKVEEAKDAVVEH